MAGGEMHVDIRFAEMLRAAIRWRRMGEHRDVDIARGQRRTQIGAEALDAARVRREEFADMQDAHGGDLRRFGFSLRRRTSAAR